MRGEVPATVVNRRDGVIAIQDIAPKAPMHLLVIPERHVDTFREIGALAATEAQSMLEFVADTARKAGLDDFRVIVNVGPEQVRRCSTSTGTSWAARELPFRDRPHRGRAEGGDARA